jgi:hypothetical protein
MTYPLLEQAPKDHNSPEFLEFLRENNEVIFEDPFWLVIANVKYDDKVKRRWFTAFTVDPNNIHISAAFDEEFAYLEWKKKPRDKQTVKRFHIHMFEE